MPLAAFVTRARAIVDPRAPAWIALCQGSVTRGGGAEPARTRGPAGARRAGLETGAPERAILRKMLIERPRLRPRAFGPLALALSAHGLALALAAVLGFAIPARLADAREKLVIGLAERPEQPPELAPLRPLDEREF